MGSSYPSEAPRRRRRLFVDAGLRVQKSSSSPVKCFLDSIVALFVSFVLFLFVVGGNITPCSRSHVRVLSLSLSNLQTFCLGSNKTIRKVTSLYNTGRHGCFHTGNTPQKINTKWGSSQSSAAELPEFGGKEDLREQQDLKIDDRQDKTGSQRDAKMGIKKWFLAWESAPQRRQHLGVLNDRKERRLFSSHE